MSSVSQLDSDRRLGERYVVVLQLGILTCGSEKRLCLILNMGQGGMKLRVFGSPPRQRGVSITMRGEKTYEAEVAWCKGDLIGVVFRRWLDEHQLIEALGSNGARDRGPRLPLNLNVLIRSGASTFSARLLNISSSGAGIELGDAHLSDRSAMLTIPGMPPIAAQVRWRESRMAGLSFNSPLLLRHLQNALDATMDGASYSA